MTAHPRNQDLSSACWTGNHGTCDSDTCRCYCHDEADLADIAICGGCGAYGRLGQVHNRNGEECGEFA